MASHPFCALVAAGGTGELYSLTPEEIEEVVRVTVDAVNGRMPVVAGTGYSAPIGADIARRVERAGADCHSGAAALLQQRAVRGHDPLLRRDRRRDPLPLMIYSRDWAVFTPGMVARVADHVPTLTFWKDGQGDARKYQRIMQSVGDRLAWLGGLGDDCVPPYFAIGVQAYTSSISNIAPRVSLELAEAGMAGDFKRLDVLMAKYVHPLYAFRERAKGYEVAAMKAAMEILGHARRALSVRRWSTAPRKISPTSAWCSRRTRMSWPPAPLRDDCRAATDRARAEPATFAG